MATFADCTSIWWDGRTYAYLYNKMNNNKKLKLFNLICSHWHKYAKI